ncbi:MAG: endonuclease MutS2 [Ruminococcaceae bacterium]|nr:endonuclease MutS2 [Oscillospiraceae bacterium]
MTENKHLRVLELDKVLELLAAECSCADAAELARELTPLNDPDEVRTRLSESWDAHMLVGRFGSPSFGGVKNIASSLRRAQAGGALSMLELLRVAEVLRIIRSLREWRGRCEGVVTSFDGLFMALQPNKYLEERITTSIISEEEMSDNASRELADIRRKLRLAQTKVRDQLDHFIRSATNQKYLQDSLITIRGGRFVVPVKAECRGSVPGLVHDTSSSGATVFIEPMAVVEANNEIKVWESKEQAEIERILAEISAEAGDCCDGITASYSVLIQLDLIFAKARLGYNMRASMPEVNDEGIIHFNKARHPLIDKDKVVATDIRLGEDFDSLMITGPNTGGKTVSIKTLGLLTAMAGCGLLIPVADQSRVAVFDRILADIGDEQSIEQSLSTFSSHMTNIIDIIDRADDRTLVLLDELGAGTDPIEGAALATAIIERLRSSGVRMAATTHYAELKSYAITTPGVENACCEFDVATLRPTYRLLIGMPGRSNAFAISERLGIPVDVVNRARDLVSSESTQFEEVVDSLQAARQQLEQEQEQISHLRTEAQQATAKATEQSRRIESERQRILDKAREEAANLVSRARAESNALLEELKQLKRELNSANAAELESRARSLARSRMRSLDDTADPIVKRDQSDYVLPRELRAGDSVLIVDIDKKGVVLRPADSSGNVEVQAGVIKTRVKLANLRLLEQETVTVGGKAPTYRSREKQLTAQNAQSEVDVRGLNVDEASIEVDKVIDMAVMRGLNEVRVIHGKGTGALRSGLHQHFKCHPSIRSFRLGTFGEGESGVTILELK